MDANFRLSQSLLDLLIQNGCKNFVFCPGARNSPLIRALFFLSASREIHLYSHFDERGAGFFALGIAKGLKGLRGLGGGAAVITTSGTAVANLYPAMVEAYYSDTPLIAITADRPARLQNLSANQTIEQRNFFTPFTRGDMMIEDPPTLDADSMRAWREVFLDRVISKLSSSRFSGPIHINCPFDEPLLIPDAGDLPVEDYSLRKEKRNAPSEVPWPETAIPQDLPSPNPFVPPVLDDPRQMMEEFSQMLGKVFHGLVILGELPQEGYHGYGMDGAEGKGILALVDFLVERGWHVIAELGSGMRGLLYNRKGVIRHYHHLLEHEECREHWRTDGVLHLGGRLLSKSLGRFLQDLKGIDYIHIDSSSHPYNPDGCVTRRFRIDPLLFSQQVQEAKEVIRINPGHRETPVGAPSTWYSCLTETDSQLSDFIREYVFRGFNELEIARTIGEFSCRLFAEGIRSPLFVGNSMPIRHLNAMGGGLGFSGIFSNRGASGIDGLIATAAGVFRGGGNTPSRDRSYAIIGDLSALHDINSLALCGEEGCPITVIVINNREGMIFRYLPIAEVIDGYPDADRFYYRHDYGFSGFAKSFSMGYRKITTRDDLQKSLEELHNDPRSWLLELEVNPEVHWEEQRSFQIEIMKRIGDGLKKLGDEA